VFIDNIKIDPNNKSVICWIRFIWLMIRSSDKAFVNIEKKILASIKGREFVG
jgi:hypothetical protein